MLNNPHSVVAIPTQLLEDLLQMARKSPQYREGYSWAASAMHQANRSLMCEKYRQGRASHDDKMYLALVSQASIDMED